MEDELFKPAEGGGKAGEPAGEGGVSRSWPWLPRGQRKLPEQTELYAQLLRSAQTGEAARRFGDHDYCALSLGEQRKRSAAMLGARLQVRGGNGAAADLKEEEDEEEGEGAEKQRPPMSSATPPSSEEEAERSPSPVLHFPASQTASR